MHLKSIWIEFVFDDYEYIIWLKNQNVKDYMCIIVRNVVSYIILSYKIVDSDGLTFDKNQ